MAKRTIAQVNKEINYLETAYQRLMIKTIPYREEMKRLLEEKEYLLNLDEKELAKIEREKKVQKSSNLDSKLRDPNGKATIAQPMVLVDEDLGEYVRPY